MRKFSEIMLGAAAVLGAGSFFSDLRKGPTFNVPAPRAKQRNPEIEAAAQAKRERRAQKRMKK